MFVLVINTARDEISAASRQVKGWYTDTNLLFWLVFSVQPGHKLMSHNDSPESQSGQYLLGMLVMQDVQLGILIALLPAFGDSNDGSDQTIILTTFLILLKTIASFIIVMGKSRRLMMQQTLNRHF